VFVSENYAVPEGNLYSEITRDYRLEQPKANQSFTLANIFFDYRSASLRPESSLELGRLAEFLRSTPGARIEVGGHTDSLGSPVFNQELSEERAHVVRQYLVEKEGIDGGRIESRGYGSSKPVASNASEEERQKNRRVEFTIITVGR
jgi:outer membrane protein OmpA-like peptidoglycan-associated protein